MKQTRHGFPALLGLMLLPPTLVAGPPFFTDDPFPVDYLHWEFYLASLQQHLRHEADATLPHIEINYGAFPEVQLHLVAPMGYVRRGDGTHYGYSDTEVGVKYRLLDETEDLPQVGIFPLLEIPTGNKDKQLGSGEIQAYLPVWLQKSWGKFTTYGGAGFWYNPGQDSKNWLFAGWLAQYDFSETLSLGGELYYHTPQSEGAPSEAAFNLGGFINLDASNHILFSAGHSFHGESTTTVYLGYQLTV
jgi:hypothetical protein